VFRGLPLAFLARGFGKRIEEIFEPD